MDVDVDHYKVLGLPSGEEGAKLSEKEISKAYKLKALELHPDKRPDDPDAHANFQMLKSSYEILKDEKARKLFDDLLKIKLEKEKRLVQQDGRKRKMRSDLEERERAAFAPDPTVKARQEEERISRELKEEIARIKHALASKGAPAGSASVKETKTSRSGAAVAGVGLDKEKMLKVSWEKGGEDYSAERLKEIFAEFGQVEDVVIKSSKKKGSALVVMSTKDAVVAATGSVCGSLSNPLLVLPVQPAVATEFTSSQSCAESDGLDNLVGAGYQAYEDSVLQKLQMAAKRQK
ncbi:dnaJ homolog subfamily C member 17-like [Mangifera indica]|uniref:dnaJ homolog subfamily C member 17-like n=1 Tax=Mangifera indica TaxID=29780 RepID=UPI001CFB9EB7|nr:dnaJ homolog subfamily C member 17-like [Mangifera indica]XP_044489391.1 dnaJ homolog subfamily C member 17-like [Mangifera indica]XP_044489392.1 dnaJ homolog subfamily C member 17-like [Mangifera indica]